MLRRLKSQVALDLPPRIEERRDCEMTPPQRAYYLAELEHSRRELARLGGTHADVNRNRISILAVLTRLRQICCHPALTGGAATLGSGKFDALLELLEPLMAEGHKVLVFSQFVECLKRVAPLLTQAGYAHYMLTGHTKNRQDVVDACSADERPCSVLISLRAGGTGLNLTAARYVVLLDPWWNPAVEAQAIDRTHRIGQDSTIIAYRLLCAGSIEEKMWELQQRKAAMVRDVLGDDALAQGLTQEDLAFLLEE